MSYTKAETPKSTQPEDKDIQYGSLLDTQYERHWMIKGWILYLWELEQNRKA